MKNQQKLVLSVLAKENKITKAQYEQGLSKLETLPSEEAGKLNWIALEFQLSKVEIMSAFQHSKELVSRFGSINAAIDSIDLSELQSESSNEVKIIDVPKPRTESEIQIQKGPSRLTSKSTYQKGEDFTESKIKHAPKLKKQTSLGGSSTSRFIDLEDSAKPEDEGLFKSSDASRPLSDIKTSTDSKPMLKRASSKVIEPKKTPSKAEENIILEAPPPIEEKQKKAFELEQIQVEEAIRRESEIIPPPGVKPGFVDDNLDEFDDVELDPIDDDDFVDDVIKPAPPPLRSNRTESELIDLSDDEIEEIEDFDEVEEIDNPNRAQTQSNRLRPRARRHRRRR